MKSDSSTTALTFEAAESKLFPSAIPSTPSNDLAMYLELVGRWGPLGYGGKAADAHARSFSSNPALGLLFRSRECIEDVGEAARRFAHPSHDRESMSEAQNRCASTAIATYKRAIAGQIAAATDGHELAAAARIYLDGLCDQDRAVIERRATAEREIAERDEAAATAAEARRAVAAELAAAVSAAAAATNTAAAAVAATTEHYRQARVRWLSAELEASAIATLRINGANLRGKYGQRDLLLLLQGASMAQITEIEGALGAALDKAEAS